MTTETEDVQNGIDFGNTLAHYGVKGMKWGVRRSEKQLAKARKKAGLDPDSDDAAKAKSVATQIQKNKGKTSSVSNQDLKILVDRLNLERQYKQLTTTQKGEGRKFAESIAKELGKETVKNAAKGGIKSSTERLEKSLSKRKQSKIDKAFENWDWKSDVTG